MKVSPYTPQRPIILGDFGEEPKTKNLPKLSEEEILAMQPASTQQLMKMDPSEPFIINDDWKREIVEREISVQEFIIYEAHRRSGAKFREGFYRADKTSVIRGDNFNGDYQGTSTSPESRARAEQAFRFTPPAEVTADEVRQKAHNLTEYKSELKEEWRPMKWHQAFWHWIKGNQVRRD